MKPLACSADFKSKATVSPARCTSAPAFGGACSAINRDNSSPVPGPAGHLGEAELGRGLGRSFADGEERKLQGSCEIAVSGKRAQGIAAGDDQGLSAIELERHVGCGLDGEATGRAPARDRARRGARPGGWRRVLVS